MRSGLNYEIIGGRNSEEKMKATKTKKLRRTWSGFEALLARSRCRVSDKKMFTCQAL